MERPLENKRPLGPFAQSDEFTGRLLGGSGENQELQEGNTLLVEILGDGPADARRMLEDVVRGPLSNFVILEMLGEANGGREQSVPGRDVEVEIVYYFVDDVRDPEVTLGQVEQFLEQELQDSPANVLQVNVLEVS